MILITNDGLVVASGTITTDETFYYCGNRAFIKEQGYSVVETELPPNMRDWGCRYVDGVFEAIPEPEPITEAPDDNQ